MSESTDAATLNHKQNFQRLAKILIMIQLPYPFIRQYMFIMILYFYLQHV